MSNGVQVSVFLLGWTKRRPTDPAGAIAAATAGRYEYSFTIEAPREHLPSAALEYAYFRQGNNAASEKVRIDRQTMATGDVATIGVQAWVCTTVGFKHVPGLYELIAPNIEAQWLEWTDEPA